IPTTRASAGQICWLVRRNLAAVKAHNARGKVLRHLGTLSCGQSLPHLIRLARRALLLALSLCVLLPAPSASAQNADGFRQFIETLWPEAAAKGVSRATFDAAFQGVTPDLSIPDLVLPGKTPSDVKGQAEFTRTPAEYLNVSQLTRLAAQAKALLV